MLESGRPSITDTGLREIAGASQKSRAIGFVLQVVNGFAVHHQNMRGPHRRFILGTFPARGQHRADVDTYSVSDEQLCKCRMGDIRSLRGERELGVRSDLDIARAHAQIGERDAAHFRIVFGGDHTSSVVVSERSRRTISA